MPNRIKILSTKKLLPSQKRLFVDAKIVLSQSDFIATQPVEFNLKNVNESLIFTSQNGILSVIQHPQFEQIKDRKMYCVGLKSKELLIANGCNVVAYAENAADLAEAISLVYSHDSFTFFSGNLRRDELPFTLKKAKVDFNEIQVYETILTPKKNTIKQSGILFFSPSAVESYLKKNRIIDEVCFCIGKTTGKELVKKKASKIVMAPQPTVEALIEIVIDYYQS
ncbi:MAG: uroporphyrinogen-III synthase [Flavobacterium sp.]|nr:uroporphyrinogen-III synthase [Flavobacterium sp.]